MTSEHRPLDGDVVFSSDRRSRISTRFLVLAVVGMILINLAAIVVLPVDAEVRSGEQCTKELFTEEGYPACYIKANLHLPRPHEVWIAGDAPATTQLAAFQISLTDSLVTMMVLTAIVLLLGILAARQRKDVPGRVQNLLEWIYESLRSFGLSMGGARAAKYVPLFAAFFVLILVFNWSGLIPSISHTTVTRAPTSDLNVTLGLALVAFVTFHVEGVRRFGVSGYLRRFFPLHEFRKGVGTGLVAMFVGILEFILEFIKPITLSMRLFGNIFGGEVALGVITGLALAFFLPVALYGLEIILTFVQALIFSTLTLMFILAAVESHEHEEYDPPDPTHEDIERGATASA